MGQGTSALLRSGQGAGEYPGGSLGAPSSLPGLGGQYLPPGIPLEGLQPPLAAAQLFQSLSHPLANQSIRSTTLSLSCRCLRGSLLPVWILISRFRCVISRERFTAGADGRMSAAKVHTFLPRFLQQFNLLF